MWEASQSVGHFHTMVAHLAVDRRGRVTGALTRESATAAIKRWLLVDLSMTSWRGWADFLLGRVQFVGVSTRQVRACTQQGRLRDISPAALITLTMPECVTLQFLQLSPLIPIPPRGRRFVSHSLCFFSCN